MAIDLKHEVTRPLALILSALAALGWVLLLLSSWSTASVQKAQRLQIVEATERSEKLAADLARYQAASGSIADLEGKLASTRDDVTRMSQAKADLQTELTGVQRNLSAVRRDVSDADRNLAAQNQKLSDLQASATEVAASAPDVAEPTARPTRSSRGGRWSRRRSSRSYSIISR